MPAILVQAVAKLDSALVKAGLDELEEVDEPDEGFETMVKSVTSGGVGNIVSVEVGVEAVSPEDARRSWVYSSSSSCPSPN